MRCGQDWQSCYQQLRVEQPRQDLGPVQQPPTTRRLLTLLRLMLLTRKLLQKSHRKYHRREKRSLFGPATPEAAPSNVKSKKKTSRSSRAEKDLSVCHTLLSELGGHDESWPFLQPVNTKQFPTYKKIIKTPMDISTIRKKLNDGM